jgi:ankyrin repeat protein
MTAALHQLQSDPEFRKELAKRLSPFRDNYRQRLEKRFPNSPMPGDDAFRSIVANMTIRQFMEIERGHTAPVEGNLVLWALALERGIDPNLRNSRGETQLHRFALVVSPVNEALTELFLAHAADPNITTAEGRTPLANAVRAGNQTVADLLLRAGARADTVSPADQFLGACRRADAETAQAAVGRHPNVLADVQIEAQDLLLDSVKNNNLQVVQLMAELGFDLAVESDQGVTPLHLASWHGYAEMVRFLVEHNAPVHIEDAIYHASPLDWAEHGSRNNPYGNAEDYSVVVETLAERR